MFHQFLCAATRVNATRKIFRTLNCNLQLNNSVSNVVKNSIRKVHILSIYFFTFDTSLALSANRKWSNIRKTSFSCHLCSHYYILEMENREIERENAKKKKKKTRIPLELAWDTFKKFHRDSYETCHNEPSPVLFGIHKSRKLRPDADAAVCIPLKLILSFANWIPVISGIFTIHSIKLVISSAEREREKKFSQKVCFYIPLPIEKNEKIKK